MAYLDTGELPWDMDLFDKTIEVSDLCRLTYSATLDTVGMHVWGLPLVCLCIPLVSYYTD